MKAMYEIDLDKAPGDNVGAEGSPQKTGSDLSHGICPNSCARRRGRCPKRRCATARCSRRFVFSGIVMEHMSDIGMTFEPVECHFEGKVGNANLRLSGYSLSDDQRPARLVREPLRQRRRPDAHSRRRDQDGRRAVPALPDAVRRRQDGAKARPISDVRSLAETLQAIYDDLEQIRVYVITDRVAKSKSFKTRDIGGKAVRLEVMDIERLHRHWSEGKPRDELVVDFGEVSGAPLPCVLRARRNDDYDYALTASRARRCGCSTRSSEPGCWKPTCARS
jgi:hypothetical protein